MPGNRSSPEADMELKTGCMVKRSQGKSTLGSINFKKRVFVMTPSRLNYYDGNMEKRGSLKGFVELNKVKVVEKVQKTTFDKPSFQIVHGDLTLYVIANSEDEREEWLTLLREYCKDNAILLDSYHPGLFSGGKWSCCDHRSKHSSGCLTASLKQLQGTGGPSPSHLPLHQQYSDGGGGGRGGGGGGGGFRGPLPPTPSSGFVQPQPQPQQQQYHYNNAHSVISSSAPFHHPPVSTSHSYNHHQMDLPGHPMYPPGIPSSSVGGGRFQGNAAPLKNQPAAVGHHHYHQQQQSQPPLVPPRPSADPMKQEVKVVAQYDYAGLEKGDLPLVKGQVVFVFDDSREYWWRARNQNGQEGFIPSNYVKKVGLESEDWYFPDLSRTRAENILKGEAKEGGFVVRNSSRENMCTLSICHEGQVRHYHIKQDSDKKYYISDKHRFPSIKELIEYHKLNGGGLVTRLRKPPAQLAPNAHEHEKMFDEEWEIDKNLLQLGKELGSGQFGRVVAGKWGVHNVAIKMMKEGSMNEDDFIEEARVMKRFKHENLVRLYGVCTRQGPIFLVQELMVEGCLLQYIRNRKEIAEKTEVVLNMAVQICSAMKYLEANGFIHRDLAARNCLVGNNYIVKVADFGLARFVVDDEYTASEGTKFPIKWAAPEVITHAKFSSKSDVWSFGILLWELWTGGKTPYPTFTNPQVLDEVLMGYRLDRPKFCPPEIYDIMSNCWLPNPEDRPPFSRLFERLVEMQGDRDDYHDPDAPS